MNYLKTGIRYATMLSLIPVFTDRSNKYDLQEFFVYLKALEIHE